MTPRGPMLTLVIDNGDGTVTATAWAIPSAAATTAALTALYGKPVEDGLLNTAAVDDTAIGYLVRKPASILDGQPGPHPIVRQQPPEADVCLLFVGPNTVCGQAGAAPIHKP